MIFNTPLEGIKKRGSLNRFREGIPQLDGRYGGVKVAGMFSVRVSAERRRRQIIAK